MSKTPKTAKKDKKTKKKQKQAHEVQSSNMKFDILHLLKTEQLDTKPSFAKFLDQHVELISVVVSNGKMQVYPTLKCSFPKILVRFLDKQELMYSEHVLAGQPRYCMYDDLDEIHLSQSDLQAIEQFFQLLISFNFTLDARFKLIAKEPAANANTKEDDEEEDEDQLSSVI